jgi:hypothetical protein
MKYFRKHPDLLLIANYPDSADRIRQARQTTPPQLAAILVNTISAQLKKTKKILLLTDAADDTQHAGLITRTAWVMNKPLSVFRLINKLIYNHGTRVICILYHPELFGRFWTGLFTPFLIIAFRISGKHVTIISITTPKISTQPTVVQTAVYFLRFTLLIIFSVIANQMNVGEKPIAHKLERLTGKKTIITIPMSFRSIKERHAAGQIIADELFPSPTHNLGLLS